MARTACLVCFISTVNGHSKKEAFFKTDTISGHITNFKQSILETLDIYGFDRPKLEKISIESANRFGKAAGRIIVTWFGVDFVAVRT